MESLAERDEKLKLLIAETQPFQMDDDELVTPYEALLEAITTSPSPAKRPRRSSGGSRALGTNGRPPTAEEMMKIRKPVLRKAGLSGAKVSCCQKDLAAKTLSGVVPSLEEAHKLSDEELVKRLTSVRGIGAWTVEMFLIFRLGRPDVLPIHDLGVQKGWSITYGKKHKPKPKELLAFGERWRPYRTIASWYMWRACHRAGNAAMRKIRPARVRRKRHGKSMRKPPRR